MKDVGMSNPQKYANKVRWDPKLNNHFHITLHKYVHYYKPKYKELYYESQWAWFEDYIIIIIIYGLLKSMIIKPCVIIVPTPCQLMLQIVY